MSSEVPFVASNRLKKEYLDLVRDPIAGIIAHPTEHNILEWHFVLLGPEESPYQEGVYHGTLHFPNDFPFKPPAIRLLTPSGRFHPNKRICLNISDFHPELWSPVWTVGSILVALLSFMLSEDIAAGVVVGVNEEKRQELAKKSLKFNQTNQTFCQMFPDLAEKADKRPDN